MNTPFAFILAWGLILMPGAVAAAEPPEVAVEAGRTITAEVGFFRSSKGSLGCRLFRSPKGFPEAREGTIEVRVPVTARTGRCEFRNVPPGEYALSVMHDENDNQILDKNIFGVPREGYGVSNNRTYALREPRWDEAKFAVTGKDLSLVISLRY